MGGVYFSVSDTHLEELTILDENPASNKRRVQTEWSNPKLSVANSSRSGVYPSFWFTVFSPCSETHFKPLSSSRG